MIEVRLSHEENASLPIAVTLGGMLIEARLEHPRNTLSPIVVTLGSMVYDSAFERKATRIPFSTSISAPSSYLK